MGWCTVPWAYVEKPKIVKIDTAPYTQPCFRSPSVWPWRLNQSCYVSEREATIEKLVCIWPRNDDERLLLCTSFITCIQCLYPQQEGYLAVNRFVSIASCVASSWSRQNSVTDCSLNGHLRMNALPVFSVPYISLLIPQRPSHCVG